MTVKIEEIALYTGEGESGEGLLSTFPPVAP